MAVARGTAAVIDGGTSGGVTTTLTLSVTVDSGSDRVMVAFIGNRNSEPYTGVVFNTSENLTGDAGGKAESATGGERQEIWWLVAPTVTTADVVFTTAGNAQHCGSVMTYVGAKQSAPLDGYQTDDSDAATSLSATVTSGATDDIVVVGVCARKNSGFPLAEDAGQTDISDNAVSSNGGSSSHIRGASSDEPGGASIAVGYSWSSSVGCSMVAANLIQVGAAASIIPSLIMSPYRTA